MSLPEVSLNCEPEELQALVPVLQKYGYTCAALSELLGRWDLAEINAKEYPNYIWRCEREETDLAKLVAIFFLGRTTDRQTILKYLGEALVKAMEDCGLLLEYEGQMGCICNVFPCSGKYFFTDQWLTSGGQPEGKVYEIGPDSYIMARVTPRREVKRALDLCTGSGIHAVFSGGAAPLSKAVDINPRALKMTELNAALNGVSCQVYLKDLFQAVPGEKFDLITANPPFVASPDATVLIHRSAGESGEEVPERLVAALPEHLEVGGLFSMILDHPVYESEGYLEKLERWLGETKGWGIAVLTFNQMTLGNYIMSHLTGVEAYDDTFKMYLESYLKLGMSSFETANVFILRLDPEIPNWKVDQKSNRPRTSIIPQVESWLDCLQKYHDPNWKPDPQMVPSLSRYYKSLWRNWDSSQGILELTDENHFPAEPLGADEAELMGRMKEGTKTVAELQKDWLTEGRTETSFASALRVLGLRVALAER